MRSIIDFVRRALASVARFAFIFVRGVGETVGHWVRVLQPAAPPAVNEPARTVDEMLPRKSSDAPGDDQVYQAIVEVAVALAAGHEPRASAARLVDGETHDWLSLLTQSELAIVSQLTPAGLRAHLTGRGHVPALLRPSRAEMIERAEDLVRRRLQDEDDLPFGERPLLSASM